MKYKDLRDFIAQLEQQGELKRIAVEIDPHLEMTEICDRVLKAGGPAMLFEKPKGHTIPVLGNLFGTPRRVAMGMGQESVEALREVGQAAGVSEGARAAQGLEGCMGKTPGAEAGAGHGAEGAVESAPCQEIVWEGKDVDLGAAADPDLLAGRRRPADHLGADRHPRAAQDAAEPGHLPPAGDRAATR